MLGTLGRAQKILRHAYWLRFDELSQTLFRCVVFVCAVGECTPYLTDWWLPLRELEKEMPISSSDDTQVVAQVFPGKLVRYRAKVTVRPDYVRESLNLSRNEAEGISFVPTAISVPTTVHVVCNNRCKPKALRFGQFAFNSGR